MSTLHELKEAISPALDDRNAQEHYMQNEYPAKIKIAFKDGSCRWYPECSTSYEADGRMRFRTPTTCVSVLVSECTLIEIEERNKNEP